MADDKHEQIRRYAYMLWENEGRPSGKDAEHWEQAMREHDQGGPVTAPASKSNGSSKKGAEVSVSDTTIKKSSVKKSDDKKPAVSKRASKPNAGS